jgi:anti-sigma factor RsiW
LIPESNASAAGPCSECELVFHAFCDVELDAADSLARERDLGQCQGCFVEEEFETKKVHIHALRNGLACTCQVAKSN